jgi:hypothetical protein
MPDLNPARLTRGERLQLAAAAVRGVLSGIARSLAWWVIEEHFHL